MHNLFENLLISSPNGGGIFLSHGSNVFRIDHLNTTGIYHGKNIFLRGYQPDSLLIINDTTHLISGVETNFDDIHDVLCKDGYCYVVSTTGNEIIKLSQKGEEKQRWTFSNEKDSWHINCLGVWQDRIVFSAFGEFREHRGHKNKSDGQGFVQDLLSGERLVTGLSQPHSLFSFQDNLFLANSERQELVELSTDGQIIRAKRLNGYTRGVFVNDKIVYVGLSCSRNIKSTDIANAHVVALDRETLEEIGRIPVPANEIYDIWQIYEVNQLVSLLAQISSTSSRLLQASLDNSCAEIRSLSQTVSDQDQQIDSLNKTVNEQDERIGNLHLTAIELQDEVSRLREEIHKVHRSKSWRITAPIRIITKYTRDVLGLKK